jgi:hypothetical protein
LGSCLYWNFGSYYCSFNLTATIGGAPANLTLPVPGAANSLSNNDAIVINGTVDCPLGYIKVPKDEAVGSWNDFCVAKYTMSDDGAGNPQSRPLETTWTSISQINARSECSSLGANYSLISNEEHMTIARNIERTPANWDGGVIGINSLNRGHHEDTPATDLQPGADDNDPCFGVTITGSCDYNTWNIERRTHRLDNDHVIWDITGNHFQWIDYNVTQANQPGASGWQQVDGLGGTIAFRYNLTNHYRWFN